MVELDCIIVHSQTSGKGSSCLITWQTLHTQAAADSDTKSKLLDLSLIVNAANQVKNALYSYFNQVESKAYDI